MSLKPRSVNLSDLGQSIRAGWRDFRCRPAPYMVFTGVFLVLGGGLMSLLVALGLAPMALSLVGAFMLFGPVVLAGYLSLRAEPSSAALMPALVRAVTAMARVDRSVWAMGAFCMFMALVWLTDAGTLYSFLVGERFHDWSMAFPQWRHRHFHGGTVLMGGALAFIVYAVSVHSVTLMLREHVPLVRAISASVRAVGASFLIHMLWALMLAASVTMSVLLAPLLLVVLPVAALASNHFTSRVF